MRRFAPRKEFVLTQEWSIELPDPADGLPRAVERILRAPDGTAFFAYRFPHPAVAATVALFDRSRQAFLLVRRANEPFRGFFAFPGGFLDVGREDIRETAIRELREEAMAALPRRDLRLVDVRSRPDRDPRDHVLDIGFYAETDKAAAGAADETSEIRWAAPAEIDVLPLAFDHGEFWRAVRAQFESRWGEAP